MKRSTSLQSLSSKYTDSNKDEIHGIVKFWTHSTRRLLFWRFKKVTVHERRKTILKVAEKMPEPPKQPKHLQVGPLL